MKNKVIIRLAVSTAAAVCLLAAIPTYASVPSEDVFLIFQEDPETVSYVIDFLDDNGELLDTKICTYGEKLTDVMIPEQKEDADYTYQFIGWEPQLPEIVTDCGVYTALYQKIEKSAVSDNATATETEVPKPEVQASPKPPESRIKATSTDTELAKNTCVTSTSYDVTSFHIETPADNQPDVSDKTPLSTNTAPDTTVTAAPTITAKEPDMAGTPEPKQSDRQTRTDINNNDDNEKPNLSSLVLSAPTDVPEPAKTTFYTDIPVNEYIQTVQTDSIRLPEKEQPVQETAKVAENTPSTQSQPTKTVTTSVENVRPKHGSLTDDSPTESPQVSQNKFPISVILAGIVVYGATAQRKSRKQKES